MSWVVFAVLFLLIVWAASAMWGRAGGRAAAPQRAPERLNKKGWPKGTGSHRQNNEE